MFRFLNAPAHALIETRSSAQKPTHKDLKPKWPKPDHLGFRPLMLRFLNAPAHALLLQAFAVLARIGLVYD